MENLHFIPEADFEISRLKELYELNILDTGKEERFDRFTDLISDLFDVPIVLIGLVDKHREWIKSYTGISINQIPRDISFCAHTLYEKEILVINNAKKDPRFEGSHLVLNKPHISFYAGALLRGPTGKPIGALSIIDKRPRKFNSRKQQQLIQFARLVERELCYSYYNNKIRIDTESSSFNDFLTGLPNRHILKERLGQAVEVAQYPQQIAVISLKINQLQELKSSAGDEVISCIINETSARLKKTLMKSDGISLWEEDHFILFITINPQTSSLLMKLENILNTLEDKFEFKEEKYSLSTNIGISIFPNDSHDANQLVENAIYAMRLLTSDSKPPYRFFSEEATTKLTKQFELEHLLIKAIETNALELYYQPKVDISSGLICGVEALCRWNDPTYGSISPTEFILIAEQSDIIIQLGEWVLKEACKKNKEWQSQGLRPIPISVNVSKKQLMKKDFPQDVKKILQESKLRAKYLDLEITESSLINIEDIIENLNIIFKLGITFSLDDFGTGYSSLSYLKNLPLKTLKIDISFIKQMVSNTHDAVMVRTIVAMAKSLGLVCLAEGVENSNQLLFLQAYQCDQIQGYLFSQPLTADEFARLLSKKDIFKKIIQWRG
ncbi:sensor domain-containing phosphodiesterase [Legionella fallonii]|uniref:Putative C-di-GMP-specific phosphodiesterase protein n=1 Tax=Legionella fallonii LLAP-10 TaxID=1212491 RepID=A0A098G1C3_9GAMM|nr:sensor domain-containing phosphodiesterase [Legionella fallonii]CEG56283.1 putative C-di-GMP-specific phosphodiesterase protein [Legionella fallonii LLAP-10]